MTPKEYDCISYYDLGLKIEGFKARQDHELDIVRNHALLCYIAPHLDPKKIPKKVTVDHVWPTGKKSDTKKVPDDRRARIAKVLKANAEVRDNI